MPDDYVFYSNDNNIEFDTVGSSAIDTEKIQSSVSNDSDGGQIYSDNIYNDQSNRSDNIDYESILTDINSNLETIVYQNDISLQHLQEIQDNSYRLYYFIGGLYVAFAIVLVVKFFKAFLF